MWDDLVCPFDRGGLAGHGDWLSCRTCGRGYPVLDSIPSFLPASDHPRWRALQERRVEALPATPPEPAPERSAEIRRRARKLEQRLAPFVELAPATKILQVGLKGEAELHHFRGGIRYGVEPLAGLLAERGLLRWGQVRWVAGRGEDLPFPDRNFQAILLGGVLDEVESPARVLAEACRCLADDGILWLTCRESGGWLAAARRLGRRHARLAGRMWEFTAGQVLRHCRRAQLRLVASEWTAETIASPAANDHAAPPDPRRQRPDRRHGELLLVPRRRRARNTPGLECPQVSSQTIVL